MTMLYVHLPEDKILVDDILNLLLGPRVAIEHVARKLGRVNKAWSKKKRFVRGGSH